MPLSHRLTVGVTDCLHETLHAGDEIDGVDRRRVAGGLEIAGDILLDRRGDADLGRRRRGVTVIPAAGGEERRSGDDQHCTGERGGEHGRGLAHLLQERRGDGRTIRLPRRFGKASRPAKNRIGAAMAPIL